jgi:hypothetical protein
MYYAVVALFTVVICSGRSSKLNAPELRMRAVVGAVG